MELIDPAACLPLDYFLELLLTTGCYAITGEHCLDQCKLPPPSPRGTSLLVNPQEPTLGSPAVPRDLRKAFYCVSPQTQYFLTPGLMNNRLRPQASAFLSVWPVSLLQIQSSSSWARWQPRLEEEGFCSANMGGWLSYWAYNQRRRKRSKASTAWEIQLLLKVPLGTNVGRKRRDTSTSHHSQNQISWRGKYSKVKSETSTVESAVVFRYRRTSQSKPRFLQTHCSPPNPHAGYTFSFLRTFESLDCNFDLLTGNDIPGFKDRVFLNPRKTLET